MESCIRVMCPGGCPEKVRFVGSARRANQPHPFWTATRTETSMLAVAAHINLCTSAKEHANAGPLEAEGRAELVLQVAFVGEVQGLWIIDKENEGGRVHSCLGSIVDFEEFPTKSCRIVMAHGVLNNLVEARG